MKFFSRVREKSGNFVDGQGNLERTWKVREKSGNLIINGYGRQTSENLCILLKRGKDVLFHEIFSSLLGATLKGNNLLPQIRSDTVSTIKLKNKNYFWGDLLEGMENCKMSGKNQEILRWMINGNPVAVLAHLFALVYGLT